MVYRTELTRQANDDLDDITDFLVRTHIGFNHSVEESYDRAGLREKAIRRDARDLSLVPRQGTRQPAYGEDIRHVTKNKAIFYFTVDDADAVVRILAIFYGGQDHHSIMRKRLL